MILRYTSYPQGIVDTFLKENNIVEKTFWDNPYCVCLLYEVDQEIVGYLLYSDIYDRAELDQLRVKDEYQGEGIASLLLERLIEECKGKKNITLEVKEDNERAIYLYKKYNFKEIAIRKGYYQGKDGILMERKE